MAKLRANYCYTLADLVSQSAEQIALTLVRGAEYEINGVRYKSHSLKDLLALKKSLQEESQSSQGFAVNLIQFGGRR